MIKFIKEISSQTLNMYTQEIESVCENIAKIIINSCVKNDFSLYFIGIGKSYNLSVSLSNSFKSIGIKSFALDANTGLHGDVGIIRDNDIILFISRSGNTDEILQLIDILSNNYISFLITANLDGKINKKVDKVIIIPDELKTKFNIIPISTLIYTYIIGMLIFKIVIEGIKFTNKDFKRYHPKNTK